MHRFLRIIITLFLVTGPLNAMKPVLISNPCLQTQSLQPLGLQSSLGIGISSILGILGMRSGQSYDYRLIVNLNLDRKSAIQFTAQRNPIIESMTQTITSPTLQMIQALNKLRFSLPFDCSILNTVLETLICQIESVFYDEQLSPSQKETLIEDIITEAVRLFSSDNNDYLATLQSISKLESSFKRESGAISKLFHRLTGIFLSQYQWTSRINYNHSEILICIDKALQGNQDYVLQRIEQCQKTLRLHRIKESVPEIIQEYEQVICVLREISKAPDTKTLYQIKAAPLHTAEALYAQLQKRDARPQPIVIPGPREYGFHYSYQERVIQAAQKILNARDDYQKKYSLGIYSPSAPATSVSYSSAPRCIILSPTSSLEVMPQQQEFRIAQTTDMTTDLSFAEVYNSCEYNGITHVTPLMHRQLMLEVHQQIYNDGTLTSQESVNAWAEGFAQKYNELTNEHRTLINDIKIFTVACYLSGGTSAAVAVAETGAAIVETAMARGAAFASKVAEKLSTGSKKIEITQSEKNCEIIQRNTSIEQPSIDLKQPGLERIATNKIPVSKETDAFKHDFKYHNRIRARGVQDPKAHNFPYSFDDEILKVKSIKQEDGSLLYRLSGIMDGKEGFFEIAVNTETKTIFHRSFVRK